MLSRKWFLITVTIAVVALWFHHYEPNVESNECALTVDAKKAGVPETLSRSCEFVKQYAPNNTKPPIYCNSFWEYKDPCGTVPNPAEQCTFLYGSFDLGLVGRLVGKGDLGDFLWMKGTPQPVQTFLGIVPSRGRDSPFHAIRLVIQHRNCHPKCQDVRYPRQ